MMNPEKNYTEINRESWNNRTDSHLESEFYDLEGFKNGNTSLNDIELDLLGDIKGKTILHLQCHFGQDSISLSRLGAEVTGIDLSNKAIDSAKQLAKETNADTSFIFPIFMIYPIISIKNLTSFSQVTGRLVGCRIWINGQKWFPNF